MASQMCLLWKLRELSRVLTARDRLCSGGRLRPPEWAGGGQPTRFCLATQDPKSPHCPSFNSILLCSYHDGEIRTMLARHSRKKSGGGIDERASTMPLPLPEPGAPSRRRRLRACLKLKHSEAVA